MLSGRYEGKRNQSYMDQSQHKEVLHFSEANRKAQEAADKLVGLIESYDPSDHAYFASKCMLLLSTKYAIFPDEE